jgi:hypothetical protein
VEVKKITHEVRLQNWSRIVTNCRNSGQTIKTWCEENNVNIKTYYHWQKQVCQATCKNVSITKEQNVQSIPTCKEPVFTELTAMPNRNRREVAVTIQRKDMQIHIYGGADIATIDTVLLALKQLC